MLTNSVIHKSFEAGADLSASQYKAVKLNSAGKVVAIAAATDTVIGVLADTPTLGQAALVINAGFTRCKLSGTVAAGDYLKIDADGDFVVAASGELAHAIALEAGATGDFCQAVLTTVTLA